MGWSSAKGWNSSGWSVPAIGGGGGGGVTVILPGSHALDFAFGSSSPSPFPGCALGPATPGRILCVAAYDDAARTLNSLVVGSTSFTKLFDDGTARGSMWWAQDNGAEGTSATITIGSSLNFFATVSIGVAAIYGAGGPVGTPAHDTPANQAQPYTLGITNPAASAVVCFFGGEKADNTTLPSIWAGGFTGDVGAGVATGNGAVGTMGYDLTSGGLTASVSGTTSVSSPNGWGTVGASWTMMAQAFG